MNENASRDLFRAIDRVIWVLTSADEERSGGLITTSVVDASIVEDLPRVTLGLAKQHNTTSLVEASGAFVLHLLREDQLDLVWRFGTQSGRDVDKLDGLLTQTNRLGVPVLSDTDGWLECRVEAKLDTGDRWWYLAEVVDAHWTEGLSPLTFQQLLARADEDQRQLLKDQLAADSLVDANAIRAWRASR